MEKLLSTLILLMVIKETHLTGNHIPVVCSIGEQVGCCRLHICISMYLTSKVTGKNVANETALQRKSGVQTANILARKLEQVQGQTAEPKPNQWFPGDMV